MIVLAINAISILPYVVKVKNFFWAWVGFPTSNGGMQNRSSVEICTRCIHVFFMLATNLYAQSVISNKNFCIGAQSKVYSECVVGWVTLAGSFLLVAV